MEAWSTSQRAAASSARSREKREKYEGVWVMLEVGGGGNNASRHCGRNSNRRTVTSVYFIFLCILFFFPFFFALFKFYGSLYKDSLGDVYRNQCFEGFLFLYRKFESLKVVNMGGWKEKKKRVT